MRDAPSDRPQMQRMDAAPEASAPQSLLVPKLVALLVAVGIAGVIASNYIPYKIPYLGHSADYLTRDEVRNRAEIFSAIDTIPLQPVEKGELTKALSTMQLTDTEKNALLADLALSQKKQALAEPVPPPISTAPAEQNGAPAPAPIPAEMAAQASATIPAISLASKEADARTGLVWITLWDTDDEDGDTVRIDARGYSRTIVLTKLPMAFAVPASPGDVVNLTGMRDGEGGGITVGVASATSHTVLPVMSVGQQLGLHVGAL